MQANGVLNRVGSFCWITVSELCHLKYHWVLTFHHYHTEKVFYMQHHNCWGFGECELWLFPPPFCIQVKVSILYVLCLCFNIAIYILCVLCQLRFPFAQYFIWILSSARLTTWLCKKLINCFCKNNSWGIFFQSCYLIVLKEQLPKGSGYNKPLLNPLSHEGASQVQS